MTSVASYLIISHLAIPAMPARLALTLNTAINKMNGTLSINQTVRRMWTAHQLLWRHMLQLFLTQLCCGGKKTTTWATCYLLGSIAKKTTTWATCYRLGSIAKIKLQLRQHAIASVRLLILICFESRFTEI